MTQAVYLKKGSTTIYIESAKVDEIIVNKVIKVQKPVVKNKQNAKVPGTLLVDLKKIEHVFNIIGFLSNKNGSGNESYASSKAVKQSLIINILFKSGDIELHYRDLVDKDYGDEYNDGNPASDNHIKTVLDKVSITDASLRADASGDSTGIKRYSLQINLTRGKIR